MPDSGSMSEGALYGDVWGPYYDDLFSQVDINAVELLDELSGPEKRMLELGVGTGRVALPLAKRGVRITGVDESELMIEKLRQKDGGELIEVVIGDFARVPVEGSFPLVFLGFNTLFCLLTQDRQVECFRNVAAHLEPGGRFVLDTFVPDMERFDKHGTRVGVSSLGADGSHAYELSIHHVTKQVVEVQSVRRSADGETVVLPLTIRYAWPAEMDLMAQMAGLDLEDRWDWYDRRPFRDDSQAHVSVYRKPA